MKIQEIRNATIIVTYKGKKLLIDPWFKKKGTGLTAPCPDKTYRQPSPLVELPLPAEQVVRGIDAVIVTHIHPDHFDSYSAEFLNKELPVFVQGEKDKKKIEKMGFSSVRVLSDAGTSFEGITLTRTKGRHGTSCLRNGGKVCGVLFSASGEKKLYVAGDTVWYKGIEEELKKHRPDVIVLNACGAELSGIGRLIMHKEDVAEVCAAAPYAKVVASHMEAVNHGTVSRKGLKDYLEKRGYIKQVLIPEDGEEYEFKLH